jgi:effector-binding domain-containing protein
MDPSMPPEVRVEQVEPLPIAVVRRKARESELSQVIPAACGEVWKFIKSTGMPHSGLNMALYLDLEMNLEIGVVMIEPFASDGPVICSQTPGGTVATAVHFGPYNRLGDAHDAIQDWCDAQGRKRAGPFWEIYGHWTDDPSKLRTDVFYLLEEAGQTPVTAAAGP